MILVVDENIPQGKEAFGNFGQVISAPGRKITNDMLTNVDALIVRSITNVNEELIKNTPVKFIGTATIGTDHVDKNYLQNKGIQFADAAGCNAYSVAEYVVASINKYVLNTGKKFNELSIGIIGCGNVGSKVARFADALDMKTIINDPPLERKNGEKFFQTLDEALSADVITFHVPLNKTGIDKTVHLLNAQNINKIKPGAMLINSSRGAVVCNESLLNRIKNKNDLFTVLDVWENEPNINIELLEKVNFGTPHIAGYSFEGKINGTKIIHDKLAEFLGVNSDWLPDYPDIQVDEFTFNSTGNFELELDKLITAIYNIGSDSEQLKKYHPDETEPLGKYFDKLRKEYPVRREFNNYKVKITPAENSIKELLKRLRFAVE